MKKIVKYVVTALVVLVVLALVFLAYMGYFSSLKVAESKIGPYTFVYEEFVGDYAKTGAIFDKLYASLKKDGIDATKGIGIYYDDPRAVAKDKLRSVNGCIIEPKDFSKIDELKAKKYKFKKIAEKDSVVIEFPLKNKFSFAIGVMKAYPVMMKYMAEKNYKMAPAMEIYDMQSKKIYYTMEIIK